MQTGEKPFVCPMPNCGKTFTEKGNLKTHLRIHSGEKPFQCNIPGCNKTFTTQGHLTDHMRRHSGERPFKCNYCDQAFMRSSTLKIHLRRHTGEKPYLCDTCGKRFSESGNLKTHIKTHVIIKKYNYYQVNKKKKSLNVAQVNAHRIATGESPIRHQQAMTLKKRKRVTESLKVEPVDKKRRRMSDRHSNKLQEAEEITLPLKTA